MPGAWATRHLPQRHNGNLAPLGDAELTCSAFLHVHQKGVQRRAGVEFAEEDCVLSAYSYTPIDADLPQQWAVYHLGLL